VEFAAGLGHRKLPAATRSERRIVPHEKSWGIILYDRALCECDFSDFRSRSRGEKAWFWRAENSGFDRAVSAMPAPSKNTSAAAVLIPRFAAPLLRPQRMRFLRA
jgi:hypothetical protein